MKPASEYVPIFKALADETRVEILAMLTGGRLCACKILERFDITQPTLSYHMKILTESGLVTGVRDGAWMRYSLGCEGVAALKDFADRLTASGQDGRRDDCDGEV